MKVAKISSFKLGFSPWESLNPNLAIEKPIIDPMGPLDLAAPADAGDPGPAPAPEPAPAPPPPSPDIIIPPEQIHLYPVDVVAPTTQVPAKTNGTNWGMLAAVGLAGLAIGALLFKK